jgi:hypothetical protein
VTQTYHSPANQHMILKSPAFFPVVLNSLAINFYNKSI